MSKKPSTGNSVTVKQPSPKSRCRPQLRRPAQHTAKRPHQNSSGRYDQPAAASIFQRGYIMLRCSGSNAFPR
jgi:hypothetical protein